MSSVTLETFGNSFLPLENFFRLFYSTVNTQNLKESKRIYKGQKRITRGFFLEINVARFAQKMRLF